MSARRWKFALAGLGALTLSCAGLRQAAALTGHSDVAVAAELASSVGEALFHAADCDKLAARVSFEEERALGGAVALNWVKGGKGLMLAGAPSPERALQEYVNVVGRNLAAQSARPTLPWTFGVLKASGAYNATSAPGGYVFVTRGLLTDMENEAQLAGVLAHEIAHVTLQHALVRYDEVKVKQCKTVAAMEAAQSAAQQLEPGWTGAFSAALQGSGGLDLDGNVGLLKALTGQMVEKLVTEGYAHKDEYAADEVAVQLLLSAGYDPQEYIRFLGRLRAGDTGGYAHHPSPKQRQSALRNLLAKSKPRAEEFPELPSEGLRKPALDAAFSAVRSSP